MTLERQPLEIDRSIAQSFDTTLAFTWRTQITFDCPEQSATNVESIVRWLIGEDVKRFEMLSPTQMAVAQQAIEYRYRVLRQRYLGLGPEAAYRNLMQRLGNLVSLRNKIRTWVTLSRERQRDVLDVLQEVVQELLQSDLYMQQQMAWINQCTRATKLRNALLFASVEEYCLRPIRNQPLLVYRFVNYLRRTSRGGLTQVPKSDLIRLVSEEILAEDGENPISLFNQQAVAEHQDRQAWEEQQVLRIAVQQEFTSYLEAHLGAVAVQWLQLYLQGRSQEEIARSLHLPIKQIYRLREKISYHAVRIFALKGQSELVGNWLETSLVHHNFGLTSQQWQQYWQNLSPHQQQLLELFKLGKTAAAVAEDSNLKPHRVIGEWHKLYLAAQAIRNEE